MSVEENKIVTEHRNVIKAFNYFILTLVRICRTNRNTVHSFANYVLLK